jgi:hypothetical protein
MWGEPRSEYEGRLAEDVRKLRAFRAEHPSWISGIGSIWSPRYHRLMPFMVISRAEFSRWESQNTGKLFELGYEHTLPEELASIPKPSIRLPLHVMFLEPPKPASAFGDEVERVAGWINDYVRVREPIVCAQTNRRGSGAILVADNATTRFGLLTAGHVFQKGVGSPVERECVRDLFFSKRVPLGSVSHCIVPQPGTAGYDAAVIDLSDPIESLGTVVAKLRDRFIAPERIVVYGAISGFVSRAAVMGQLVEVDYGPARWLNCWMVAPSGMLGSGDSGSAVFTREDNAFLGLYVGSCGYANRPLFHYVQDGWSLQQNILNGWNVSY